MKKTILILVTLFCVFAMVFMTVSCDAVLGEVPDENFQPAQPKEGTKKNPINLTVNNWSNGEIIHPDSGGTGEQWFKFTATESIQYVYVKMSTITYLNVYLYDSNFNQIGINLNVQGSNSVGENLWALKNGEIYYLKVTGEYYDKYHTGSYWIGFTDFPAQPETDITRLIQNYWINGNIIHPNSGGTGVQWFSFTANDITQHIYVKMSTITYLNVYLYDSAFNQIGKNLNVQGTNSVGNALWSLKKGETYYLKVTGEYYNKYYTGSYWITFNDTGVEPQ